MESWGEQVYDFSTSNISQIKIVEAVKELAKTHSFNDITVNMICEKAKLSRQTFYYHFKSKWEVARWYWCYIASQNNVIEMGKNFSWHESLVKGFSDLYADRDFFANVTNHEGSVLGSLGEFCCDSRNSSLLAVIQECTGEPATNEIAFQVEFFVKAEYAMVINWINSNEPESPEEFAAKIESCIPQDLYNLVGSSASD